MPSPKTWEGWVIIVMFALLTGFISQYTLGPVETGKVVGNEVIIRIIIFSIALAVEIYWLFRISYKYGEESPWQWGEDRDKDKSSSGRK